MKILRVGFLSNILRASRARGNNPDKPIDETQDIGASPPLDDAGNPDSEEQHHMHDGKKRKKQQKKKRKPLFRRRKGGIDFDV